MSDVPQWVWLVYAGLFGAIIGSFLNVVVHRLPLGQSIVTVRSSAGCCSAADAAVAGTESRFNILPSN